jgi:hypothetical protein
MSSDKQKSPILWIALGGGLLLLSCCCFSGVGYWFYAARQTTEGPIFGPVTGTGSGTGPVEAPGPTPTPLVIPPAPRPFGTTRTILATVERVGGTVAVNPGDSCSFAVEVRDAQGVPQAPNGYWCHTVVVCGMTTLYGGAQNGFFPCAVYDNPPSVQGEDGEMTSSDTDGSFQLDTQTRTLIIRDDATGSMGAFRVEARIDSVF